MIIEVRLPAMGEGIVDATISRWLVKPGEFVSKDSPLVEISTDKVDSEIVAPSDGFVNTLQFSEGELAKVGEILILLSTEKDENTEQLQSVTRIFNPVKEKITYTTKVNKALSIDSKINIPNRYISPFIRSVALQEGISIPELETIPGSGLEGRITKEDIIGYLENRSTEPARILQPDFVKTSEIKSSIDALKPVNIFQEDVEYVELTRMRKMIASNMLKSKQTAPHVSSFVEVNVTKLANWRSSIKQKFAARYQENLTFLPLFIEAVVSALKKFPSVNASLEGDYLLVKKNINIGIATALHDGNLIVPVISKADSLDLPGLTKQLNDLSHRARESALLPSEVQGGTFTITNVGSVGNAGGTPIIRQPELAILAIGSIVKKPVAVKIGEQYGVAIADVVELWLSYDHRIIDGALGGSFLKHIADYLEDFDDTRTV